MTFTTAGVAVRAGEVCRYYNLERGLSFHLSFSFFRMILVIISLAASVDQRCAVFPIVCYCALVNRALKRRTRKWPASQPSFA